MPKGSKVASKKKPVTESIHDRDRIIVRLPDGMRDRLAEFAEANGRSMTAEVVAAIEQHFKAKDRVSQLWDLFEKYREDLESISWIGTAVEELEDQVSRLTGGLSSTWVDRMKKAARKAARPPITAEQAQEIRMLIKKNEEEEHVLRYVNASAVEQIKDEDFKDAMGLLRGYRSRDSG
jgi:predicted DNA-binding protein